MSCRISLCDVRVPCRMSLYDSIRAAVVGQIYTCWPPPLAPDPDRDSGSAFRNMFPASSRALAPQFIHLSGPGTCHATGSPRRSCLSSRRPCSRCPPLPTPRSRARLPTRDNRPANAQGAAQMTTAWASGVFRHQSAASRRCPRLPRRKPRVRVPPPETASWWATRYENRGVSSRTFL